MKPTKPTPVGLHVDKASIRRQAETLQIRSGQHLPQPLAVIPSPIVSGNLKPREVLIDDRLALLGELAAVDIESVQVAIIREQENALIRDGDEVVRPSPPAILGAPFGHLVAGFGEAEAE